VLEADADPEEVFTKNITPIPASIPNTTFVQMSAPFTNDPVFLDATEVRPISRELIIRYNPIIVKNITYNCSGVIYK
jgi:hypothetical protein